MFGTRSRRMAAGVRAADEDTVSTGPALRAKAVGLLARREHSRAELKQKLLRSGGDAPEIDALLDALEEERLLSDLRFAEGMARTRSVRYGSQRVMGELRQKGVDGAAAGELIADLRASDMERAQALWARKFGVAPDGAAERARQMRFLQARGFPVDVIRRVVPRAGSEA